MQNHLKQILQQKKQHLPAVKWLWYVDRAHGSKQDVLKINPDIQIGFDGYPVNADVCKVIAGSDQALRVNKDSEVLDATLASSTGGIHLIMVKHGSKMLQV